jgi:signal transduction histidine kinase/ActR/RegA family two-component response regulator
MATLEQSRVARLFLQIIVAGSLFVLGLEGLQQADTISDFTESAVRLMVVAVLLGSLVMYARNVVFERSIRIAAAITIAMILAELTLGVVEDIPALQELFRSGWPKALRNLAEKVVMTGWTCSTVLLIFMLVRSAKNSQQRLEQRILERTQELTESHRRLEVAHAELERHVQQRTVELRNSEQRLRLILASAPVAITSMDRDHVIDFQDGCVMDLVGIPRHHFVGRRFSEVWRDNRPLTEALRVVLAGGDPAPVMWRAGEHFIETRFTRVEADDQTTGAIAVCLNVTEQVNAFNALHRSELEFREANARLEATLKELRDAQRQIIQRERLSAIGQMAGAIAHDLNNALVPIVTVSELLVKSSDLSTYHRSQLDLMMGSIMHVADIVRQLQVSHRPHAHDDEFAPVDIVALVNQTIAQTRPKWHTASQRSGALVTVDLRTDEFVPHIFGNAVELRQLLTNLIFNSADAMPNGGRISVRLSAQDEFTMLEVKDEGIGMSADDQRQCFEPYFTTKSDGTGLGLSVCKGIVERHSGRIELTSRLGHGTTVRVWLPAIDAPVIDAPVPEPELIETEFSISTSRRVLFIDDNPLVRESMQALFYSLGVQADVVEDGATALRLLDSDAYGLVMTDAGMSDMTGFDIIRAVKAKCPDLPVVLVSGWAQSDLQARMDGDCPADFVLEKPATMKGILGALELIQDGVS